MWTAQDPPLGKRRRAEEAAGFRLPTNADALGIPAKLRRTGFGERGVHENHHGGLRQRPFGVPVFHNGDAASRVTRLDRKKRHHIPSTTPGSTRAARPMTRATGWLPGSSTLISDSAFRSAWSDSSSAASFVHVCAKDARRWRLAGGGVAGFLPVLGFWMIPLGLLFAGTGRTIVSGTHIAVADGV